MSILFVVGETENFFYTFEQIKWFMLLRILNNTYIEIHDYDDAFMRDWNSFLKLSLLKNQGSGKLNLERLI